MPRVSYTNRYRGTDAACPNVLIRCMDFRFHRALEHSLKGLLGDGIGFDDWDSPGMWMGGSRAVLDEECCNLLLAAIDFSVGVHGAKRIVIADHVDCGAYGGSSVHATPEDERQFHYRQLQQACEVLRQTYQGLPVVAVYQDWDSIQIVGQG